MANCAVMHHNCKSETQDLLHGTGNRVFNLALKAASGAPGWRCTVCQGVVVPPKTVVEDIKKNEAEAKSAKAAKK